MLFLMPSQQYQTTEGIEYILTKKIRRHIDNHDEQKLVVSCCSVLVTVCHFAILGINTVYTSDCRLQRTVMTSMHVTYSAN